MAKPNKGLGRGLDALLSGGREQGNDTLQELKVEQLKPGKYQPRSRMDEESLKELAASIKAQGIMQPILARELVNGDYEIIAGERRWRAAQLAGLTQVPVLLRKVPDNAALAMALIENIQREDLDPIEISLSYKRLIDECNITQEQLGEKVNKQRSTVTNFLRLLKLPAVIQKAVGDKDISMGHALA